MNDYFDLDQYSRPVATTNPDRMVGRMVTIYLDGGAIEAFEGETVAGALLRHGVRFFSRHPVEDRNSTPFCMMGICHECCMELDGKPNRQACLTPVHDGLRAVRSGPVSTGVFSNTGEGDV